MSMFGRLLGTSDTIQYTFDSVEGLDIKLHADISVHTLYTAIFTAVFSRTTNIDDKYKQLFYNNGAINYNNKYGIIHYLVDAISRKGEKYYIKVVNTGNPNYPFKIERVTHQPTDKQKIDEGIVTVESHLEESILVRGLYLTLAYTNSSMYKNVQIANTPIIKLMGLRDRNNSNMLTALKESIKAIAIAFTSRFTGKAKDDKDKGIVLDAGDSVEFATIDTEPIESIFNMMISQISSITGLPRSFIGGDRATSLGDSGLADDKQLDFALEKYFYGFFKPVVDELLSCNCKYVDYSVNNSVDKLNLLGVNKEDEQFKAKENKG